LVQENQRTEVTEDEVRQAFLIIRGQLTSGKLQSLKQIVDAYVQKIEVFPDKIAVSFNFFPDITLDTSAINRVENDDEGCAVTQPSFDGKLQLFTLKSANDSSGEGSPLIMSENHRSNTAVTVHLSNNTPGRQSSGGVFISGSLLPQG